MANTGALGTPGATQSVAPPAAASPFSKATSNLLASPSWTDQVSGYLAGQAAPAAAQGALGSALGSASLGMVGPQEGVASSELEANSGYDLANALLGEQGIGLQEQGLGAQTATQAKQQGLEEAQYGVSATQYPEQQAEAALANKNAVIANRDSAAIGGVADTTSTARTASTQAQEYGWQQADIYRAQQLAALGQQSEEVGYQGQQATDANQMQQLELAAKGAGLSGEQAMSQLGFGLNALGYGASPEQYLSTTAQAQGAGASALAGLGSQAALIGGLGPNFASYLGG
jgi:hypothetical protein